MIVRLTPHPDTPCDAINRIEVEATRIGPKTLALRYVAFGDISRLVVPAWVKPSRTAELWRTTCFEAFLRDRDDGFYDYYELNFSPSNRWDAYGFTGYRVGTDTFLGIELEATERRLDEASLALSTTVYLDRTSLSPVRPWSVGLSAVIEETSGAKSYWALAHAPGKPDFHHPDAFVLDLPA